MEVKSIRHNFYMYSIRMFSNFGFILLVFPYVARKIGVENIGKIQYIETIVGYFLLIINLGILDYGKREVAQYRDDKKILEEIVNELFTILLITTILGSLFYFIFLKVFVNSLVEKYLFRIYFFNIILNLFSFEWFYLGIENQEYITKRNLIVKLISGLLIILCVKESRNIYLYCGILVIANAGSNLYNFFQIKKIIKIKIVKFRECKKRLKLLFYLFASSLALSVAYHLDSVMIMKFVGEIELGYYTLAIKFGKLPLVIGSTVVAVLSPRLSNLLNRNLKEEYIILLSKGINIMYLFYIPCMFGIILLSKNLVLIFGGEEFLPAVILFKVFAIYIFIMGLAVGTGIALGTNRKDKEYFISVIVGIILNVIFNIIFIPRIGALGAAIATIITEIISILLRIVLCKSIFKEIKLINLNIIKILISSLVMLLIVILIKQKINGLIIQVILSSVVGGGIYIMGLIILKEKLLTEFLKNLKGKKEK